MPIYIKANPKVAEYLGVTLSRYHLEDGNYLLWQADILKFGYLNDLPLILAQIGGVALTPAEAKLEQTGEQCHELPIPSDPRFRMEGAEVDTPENTPEDEVEVAHEEEGGDA